MGLKATFDRIAGLEGGWKPGLQALRNQDKANITLVEPRRLTGSIDLDAALMHAQPQASRWDFGIGHKRAATNGEYLYWVEVHTGSTGEVSVVLQKLEWLKDWLKTDGKALMSFDHSFYWVSSGSTSIRENSPQARRLAQSGLLQVGRLTIGNI